MPDRFRGQGITKNRDLEFPTKHLEPADVIAMFMGEKDAVEFVRRDSTLGQAEHELARAQPAINEQSAMIGRDQRFRGGGYGGDLLVDALRRIAVAADAIGIAVVMLDVLDCGSPDRVVRRRALYESYGFRGLASNPLRMFLPLSIVRSLIAEESAQEQP